MNLKGQKTILLVEDEAILAMEESKQLEKKGIFYYPSPQW